MTVTWRVVYVEDDAKLREGVKELLDGEEVAGGKLSVTVVEKFEDAQRLLAERKVDLLVLDVFGPKGHPDSGSTEQPGLKVLEEWKAIGFAPVLLFTALPERVADATAAFVRVVSKEKAAEGLLEEIKKLFEGRVPQTSRAISEHVEESLRSYMWKFVAEHWDHFKDIIDKPEFLRLLVARLSLTLGRNLRPILQRAYGVDHPDPTDSQVHPADYYVIPPVGTDVLMGDVRKVGTDLWFVLWPSCDMVMRGKPGSEACKVEHALCARLLDLSETNEFKKWAGDRSSKSAKNELAALMKNNRSGGQSERFHYLPGIWTIAHSVVDFGSLQHLAMSDLHASKCMATVASPFAESMSARFMRYLARLGTPDLDVDALINGLS